MRNDIFDLDGIVERNSFSSVLEMLAEIAYEKADHVRSSYQNENLAKALERVAKQLQNCASTKALSGF